MRICLVALLAAAGPAAARAQETTENDTISPSLRQQVLERYRVIVIREGVVLTPRRGPSRNIEITPAGVAIDGAVVSGRELRDQLGDDAQLVVRLSYASAEALRRAFGERPASPAPPAAELPGAPQPPEPPALPSEPDPDEARWPRSSGAKVRIGGSVHVEEDERVRDAVVAVGGSATILGRVDDDVVAIGGGVRLGPKSVVRGGVTSIGGPIHREPGAEVHGDVTELGFGVPIGVEPLAWMGMVGHDMFSGWFRLVGTGLRIAVLLLITLIIGLAADRPVSRIAARAGDEPWLSGFVGLLAEILFVPILIVTVVFLAISIIGIPLLLLVPFALVALLLGVLMGFAGVVRRVGQLVVGSERGPLVATSVGVVLVAAGAILARLLWLLPGPIWPVAMAIGALGLLIEYLAWTVGLGALLLTRFGTQPKPAYTPDWPPPVPPVPPAPPPAPNPL
jgi:hypothetical protein